MSDDPPRVLRERPATLEDLDALWALHLATMKDYLAATYGWEHEEQRKLFREEWPDNCGDTVVVCDGQRVVATARVARAPDSIHLACLEVAPQYQRRGIGSAQVSKLLEEGRQRQIPVWLNVMKSDPLARKLYERLGFRPIGESPTHIRMQADPSRVSDTNQEAHDR